jgi:hypothetical protein
VHLLLAAMLTGQRRAITVCVTTTDIVLRAVKVTAVETLPNRTNSKTNDINYKDYKGMFWCTFEKDNKN